MKEIYLYGLITITNIEITNKQDIIISLSNGSICIYNHSYNTPEYIISYHYKRLTNFIWFEKQKSIISVSHDKSIKVYQLPFKWPAEFIRKNKEINNANIIQDIIQETRNIYYSYDSKNKSYNNNYYEEDDDNNYNNKDEINNSKKEGIKYGNFWDIGNLDSRNIRNKEIKSDKPKVNNEKLFINNNNNILNIYNISKNKNENDKFDSFDNNKEILINKNDEYKIENYEEYFYIFSDDLDGWSNKTIN